MERLFLRSKPLLHNIRPAIVQSRFTHHLRVSNLYLHHHQTTVQTNKETIRFYHSDRIPWQDDLVGTYSTNEGDSVSVTKFMTVRGSLPSIMDMASVYDLEMYSYNILC